MRPRRCLIGSAAVLLAAITSGFGLPGVFPVLTNPGFSGNQFQVTLHGETNLSYVIESSSELSTWTPVLTNSASQATRTLSLFTTANHAFWRARSVPGRLFEYAILARGGINLGGSGRIDSFDSTNPLESSFGQYDPVKATDRAVVATAAQTLTAITVGNVKIYGFVATGPGGTVTVSPNGKVGSTTYNQNPSSNGTIEPGHFINHITYYIPPAELPVPFGPLLLPSAGTVGGTNYNYVLNDGDYRISAMTLGPGAKIIVTGKARLFVVGTTTVTGSGYVLISSGASLAWYAGGDVSFGGGGCINTSGLAANFSIIGLNSSTAVSYTGSSRLIGTIHAPSAAVNLAGTSDAIGAVIGNSFSLSGTMGLHFDESLKDVGP